MTVQRSSMNGIMFGGVLKIRIILEVKDDLLSKNVCRVGLPSGMDNFWIFFKKNLCLLKVSRPSLTVLTA